jgi:hypothetical protein
MTLDGCRISASFAFRSTTVHAVSHGPEQQIENEVDNRRTLFAFPLQHFETQ